MTSKPLFKKSPEVTLYLELDGEFEKILSVLEYARSIGVKDRKLKEHELRLEDE